MDNLFGDILGSVNKPEDLEPWRKEWRGMPEFIQEELTAKYSIQVNFETLEDLHEFSRLVGQKLTFRTRSIWFPEAEIGTMADKKFIDEP